MGCICSKPTNFDKGEIQNTNNNILTVKLNNESDIDNLNNSLPHGSPNNKNTVNLISSNIINPNYEDFPEKILSIINYIRQNPQSYSNVIEKSIENIIEEPDKKNPNKTKLVYKQKVKVALAKGVPAFKEAAVELNNTLPMKPLVFREEICLPLPNTEAELFDSNFIKEKVKSIMQKYHINVFFKEMVKIPEVSALLMIVDDNGKSLCKKRNALLNPNFKYIGIRSKFIGKNFIAFFSFSKNLGGYNNDGGNDNN